MKAIKLFYFFLNDDKCKFCVCLKRSFLWFPRATSYYYFLGSFATDFCRFSIPRGFSTFSLYDFIILWQSISIEQLQFSLMYLSFLKIRDFPNNKRFIKPQNNITSLIKNQNKPIYFVENISLDRKSSLTVINRLYIYLSSDRKFKIHDFSNKFF